MKCLKWMGGVSRYFPASRNAGAKRRETGLFRGALKGVVL